MKRLVSYLAMGVGTALLGVALPVNAGTTTGEMPRLSLTEKLDMGGTILEPGDYRIKVVQVGSDRNLLEVKSIDGKKVYATVLSVPHTNEGMVGDEVPANRLDLYPAAGDQVAVLRTWYPPNTPLNGGHDIVYPRRRAIELAARNNDPVIAFPDDVQVAGYESAPLVVVTRENDSRPFKPVVVQTPPDSGQTQQAEVVDNQEVDNRTTRERLPQTASKLPLYAGLGLLSIVGALALGVLAKRMA